MNSSARKRILRGRIERGEYVPKTPLMKLAVSKPAAGLLQCSRSFRKDLTQVYVEDAFQRSRVPQKVRDPRWAFLPKTKGDDKDDAAKPVTPLRDAYDLMFAE